MPQISIIQKTDILEAGRFDAEYFKHEYLEIEQKVNKTGYFLLKNISKNHNNKREPIKKESRGSGEYPYYGAQGIGSYIDKYIFDGEYLLVAEDGENLRSRKNDIAFSVNGKFWVNNHAHILSFDNFKIEQIVRNYLNILPIRAISGVAQPKLSKENLDNIRIPKILFNNDFQIKIEKIVKEAHQKQAQSKQLYQQAEQLLLEELDLVDYQPQYQLSFSTTKNDIVAAQRFDSEYFQPKYFDIINKIENYLGGFDEIKNIVNWKKGIEVGTDAYTKAGKNFVRVSDVSVNGIEAENRKISIALFTKIKDKFQPKKGDILFSKDGTIGISYVLKSDIDGIISSAFLRLALKDGYQNFEKECLTLILNSIICKLQIEQLSGGAIIAHLKPSDFEKFKIPLIKSSIQTKISNKITQSHQLRAESKELLECAKLKVEQEIEKPLVAINNLNPSNLPSKKPND